MATELLFVPCGGLDELLLSDIFKPIKDTETQTLKFTRHLCVFPLNLTVLSEQKNRESEHSKSNLKITEQFKMRLSFSPPLTS